LRAFPLRVALDGEKKTTGILDKKPAAKKPRKHNIEAPKDFSKPLEIF